MNAGVKKMLLAIRVPDRWSSARREASEAAVASGYTSVRISKRTAAQLEELRRQITIEMQKDPDCSYRWGNQFPMTELLDWISAAKVVAPEVLGRACKEAIAELHAKSVDGKSMQSPRPRRVHAGSVR